LNQIKLILNRVRVVLRNRTETKPKF